MEAIKKISSSNVALSSTSFILLTLGLGLPIWIRTTTVERHPLPYHTIQGLPDPSELRMEYTVCDILGKPITLPAPTKKSKLLFTNSPECDITIKSSSTNNSPILSDLNTLIIPPNTSTATQSKFLENILTPNPNLNIRFQQTAVLSILTSSSLAPESYSEVAAKVKARLNSDWQGLIQFQIIVEVLRYDRQLFVHTDLVQAFNYLESNVLSADSEKHTYHMTTVLDSNSEHDEYHVANWGSLRFSSTLTNIDEIVSRSFKKFIRIPTIGYDSAQRTPSEMRMAVIGSTIHSHYGAAHHQLTSLVAMLYQIKNIVVKKTVAEKIARSVTLMETVRKASSMRKVKLFENLVNANWLAEAAGTDDSLLGLLYFPEDQKFGIYIPMFLPALMSILGGVKALYEFLKSKPKLD